MEDSAVGFFDFVKAVAKKTPINWISFLFILYISVSLYISNSKMDKLIKSQIEIKKDIEDIRKETNERFYQLNSQVNQLNIRFDNLYEILLKEKTEKK